MFALSGLALVLAAVVGPSEGLPAQGEVVVGALDVYDAPEPSACRSARVRRGAIVTIRDASPQGWLAIDPPVGCFEWIEERAIRREGRGESASVVTPRAVVRSGIAGARLPGPIIGERKEGECVRLVDLPPLTVSGADGPRAFSAIAPAQGEVRYVRAAGVARSRPGPERAPEIRAAYFAAGADGDIKNDLAQTEAMHRAVLRGPIDQWWLEPVKARYQALLPRAGDSVTASVIRERLAVVERQEETAREALAFESVLQRSRLRDGSLAQIRQRLASIKRPDRPSFDAEGVIQPSARKIEGEKAVALIGPDGFAVAYLRMPPGLDARSFMTRRVGVRGIVHYDDQLHARVIAVSDVEALERAR